MKHGSWLELVINPFMLLHCCGRLILSVLGTRTLGTTALIPLLGSTDAAFPKQLVVSDGFLCLLREWRTVELVFTSKFNFLYVLLLRRDFLSIQLHDTSIDHC